MARLCCPYILLYTSTYFDVNIECSTPVRDVNAMFGGLAANYGFLSLWEIAEWSGKCLQFGDVHQ